MRAVLETGSEEASLEKRPEALTVEQGRGGLWAGEESSSEGRWRGQQRSPWALQAMILEVRLLADQAFLEELQPVQREACWAQPFRVVCCSFPEAVLVLPQVPPQVLWRGACWAWASSPALPSAGARGEAGCALTSCRP